MRAPELIKSLPVANTLGEGVLWHPAQQAVWWTDIQACKLHRYHPESESLDTWNTPDRLAAFGFIESSDQLIAAFDGGFALYNPHTGERHWLSQPESHLPNNRFNDGKVDRQGRFWAGTMVERGEPQSIDEQASVYSWGDSPNAVKHLSGFQITNGLCWSPDSRTVYLADSPLGIYYAYDFDPASGSFSNRRVFAKTPKNIGPDGSCVDANGNVWNAQWGGSRVVCYSPEGEVLQQLDMPVSQPTCVAFGGPDYSWLFVTTARENLTPSLLQAEPEAGNLFIYRTDAAGLPADYFRA
ncbi:SMP-30/gluconolactonase/LRE family protein [Marinimicrobium sp. ABcell2]|uniref:SMP-30/gluconolactonase/LRE family protein n=1 Tax=Marinimicrobium sp. ABcell2 TaxID=3069751 RepID=UPI0027B22D62|nr:SMP-30/gluconolactonase/LRE family protein [Marinimicrobium sp. ABcell2]MDQ2077103.1 SMP-30/gluconolactonase/LRE family protein [Marinimicrobium sp. ABcell2]